MIIYIIGSKGSGKTLLLIYYANRTSRMIWSNLKLKNFKNYKDIGVINLLDDIPNYTLLLLDEIHTFIESRASGNDLNILANDLFLQSRKTFVDILGTDVLYSLADKRYRLTCDLLIEAKYRINDNSDDFIYFYNYIENGKIIHTEKFILTYNYAKKYLFPLYNTYQIQKSSRHSRMKFNIAKKDADLLLTVVQNICNEIDNDIDKITHDNVKASLIDYKYDLGFEKYVYPYLKKHYPRVKNDVN